MDETGAPDPCHPIVVAGLALLDLTTDDIRDTPEWRRGISIRHGGRDQVRITASPHEILVRYPATGTTPAIRFYMTEDLDPSASSKWVHLVSFRGWVPPDTLMASMPGRTLDRVVGIPGGDGLRIVDAREMNDSLVLTIGPAEGGRYA